LRKRRKKNENSKGRESDFSLVKGIALGHREKGPRLLGGEGRENSFKKERKRGGSGILPLIGSAETLKGGRRD